MILLWLYGWLSLACLFAAGIWWGVAWRNRVPFRARNVVLMNSLGVFGIAATMAYLGPLRIFDTIATGANFQSTTMPLGYLIGMVGLNLSVTVLVWTGSLRREDFLRLDGPTTIATSWFAFAGLLGVWSAGCLAIGLEGMMR